MTQEEKKSVDRILYLIESDPKTGHVGIAEQLGLITKRVDSIENRHKVIYRVGVLFGAIGGGVITWVIKLKSII